MEQHSGWNFRRAEKLAPALALLAALLAGCAAQPAHDPVTRFAAENARDSAAPYLLALREYLAQPAGAQARHRDRLRAGADRNDQAADLAYALALSVDRDDRATLEAARERFERLLAAPDPLPVAVDALVRLQLGQVIDRLERMEHAGAIYRAGQATAAALNACRVQLDNRETELGELRDKLEALTRIEQTVNESQENARQRNPDTTGDNADGK